MKYKVEVGSFCTRLIQRTITVQAKSEADASEKAIEKFIEIEMKLANSNDFGTPRVDFVEEVR